MCVLIDDVTVILVTATDLTDVTNATYGTGATYGGTGAIVATVAIDTTKAISGTGGRCNKDQVCAAMTATVNKDLLLNNIKLYLTRWKIIHD